MRTRYFRLMSAPLLLILLIGMASHVSAKTDIMVENQDEEHEWGEFDNPAEFDNPQYFMAIYGQLSSADDIDILRLNFDKPSEAWPLHILIPTCHNEFRPMVAVIGPDEDIPDALPFDLPDNMGALLYESYEEESITASLFDQDFRPSPIYSLDFERSGTYFLAIWEPNGNIGSYTLATGNEHPNVINWTDEKDEAFQLVASNRWWRMGCESSS